jgi:transcriptional coactivator p15 (PC4)
MTESTRFGSERARKATRRGGRDTDLDICSDPAFAAHLVQPLSEPEIVFQLWKGRQRTECIRATLSQYKGKPVFDVRVFFVTQSGHMQASKKGITVSIAKLPDLRKALEKAEARAIDLNLIEAVS